MWRLFGTRQSADTLFDAMSGESEQNRMLAGISLVKGGQRSFDFIEQKVDAGEATPLVLRLLPDIDPSAARDVLNRIVDSQGGLAETARQCINTLDRIEAFDEEHRPRPIHLSGFHQRGSNRARFRPGPDDSRAGRKHPRCRVGQERLHPLRVFPVGQGGAYRAG